MHYLELKIHCAYFIVLKICRDLEEILPRLPEAGDRGHESQQSYKKFQKFFLHLKKTLNKFIIFPTHFQALPSF